MENILSKLEQEYLSELDNTISSEYQITWKDHPELYNSMFDNGEVGRRKRQIERIAIKINQLISENVITEDFTILDVFCGDGLFLYDLKQYFPKCKAYGVDVYKTEWKALDTVTAAGVKMFRIPVQKLVNSTEITPDLIMMMNSYRAFIDGRPASELESNSFSIPISIEKINKWVKMHSKYFIWEDRI